MRAVSAHLLLEGEEQAVVGLDGALDGVLAPVALEFARDEDLRRAKRDAKEGGYMMASLEAALPNGRVDDASRAFSPSCR